MLSRNDTQFLVAFAVWLVAVVAPIFYASAIFESTAMQFALYLVGFFAFLLIWPIKVGLQRTFGGRREDH